MPRSLANSGIRRYRSVNKEGRPITSGEENPQKNPVTWHTAFRDGIRLTLYPYRDVLSFEFEYPLNREPLRIDAVIIKKRGEAVMGENG